MRALVVIAVLASPVLMMPPAMTQEKKPAEKKIEPRSIVVLPLGMKAGATRKLTIRGLGLEGTKEIRFETKDATGKVIRTGKAGAPDKNPEKVGDTEVVVEVKLGETVQKNISFTLLTANGETKPHVILIDESRPTANEIEPNDGFRKPQFVKESAVVIEGKIDRARDVDVFAVAGKKGQTLRAEILATRFGSAFDPHLTLFRSGAIQLVARPQIIEGDPILEFPLPDDDTYFLVVNDALDTGGDIHAYRLILEFLPKK